MTKGIMTAMNQGEAMEITMMVLMTLKNVNTNPLIDPGMTSSIV